MYRNFTTACLDCCVGLSSSSACSDEVSVFTVILLRRCFWVLLRCSAGLEPLVFVATSLPDSGGWGLVIRLLFIHTLGERCIFASPPCSGLLAPPARTLPWLFESGIEKIDGFESFWRCVSFVKWPRFFSLTPPLGMPAPLLRRPERLHRTAPRGHDKPFEVME